MATSTVYDSELDAFKHYIYERGDGTLEGHSLAEAIEEFREYQQQLAALREKISHSEESAEREGTRPLTKERLDGLCHLWEQELRDEGVVK